MGPRDRVVDDVVVEGPGGWRTMAALAIGAAAWELLASRSSRFPIPTIADVARTGMAMALDGGLAEALAASLVSLALGFLAAALAGVALGVLIGRSAVVEHLTDVYLDAIMSAPTLIYVPVLFAAFGVSRASQVAVVFAYAVFVIIETTSTGVRAADRRLIDMARAFGASEHQVFAKVALPAAAPFVLTGLGLGMTRAVKGMVVGEMVIALSGVGAMLRARGARVDLAGVLALLVVIVLVSTACNAIVRTVGRRALGQAPAR